LTQKREEGRRRKKQRGRGEEKGGRGKEGTKKTKP